MYILYTSWQEWSNLSSGAKYAEHLLASKTLNVMKATIRSGHEESLENCIDCTFNVDRNVEQFRNVKNTCCGRLRNSELFQRRIEQPYTQAWRSGVLYSKEVWKMSE